MDIIFSSREETYDNIFYSSFFLLHAYSCFIYEFPTTFPTITLPFQRFSLIYFHPLSLYNYTHHMKIINKGGLSMIEREATTEILDLDLEIQLNREKKESERIQKSSIWTPIILPL